MFNEHISKHHSRINLNIDIERLGKAYFDFPNLLLIGIDFSFPEK